MFVAVSPSMFAIANSYGVVNCKLVRRCQLGHPDVVIAMKGEIELHELFLESMARRDYHWTPRSSMDINATSRSHLYFTTMILSGKHLVSIDSIETISNQLCYSQSSISSSFDCHSLFFFAITIETNNEMRCINPHAIIIHTILGNTMDQMIHLVYPH